MRILVNPGHNTMVYFKKRYYNPPATNKANSSPKTKPEYRNIDDLIRSYQSSGLNLKFGEKKATEIESVRSEYERFRSFQDGITSAYPRGSGIAYTAAKSLHDYYRDGASEEKIDSLLQDEGIKYMLNALRGNL
jgi:hypothetical protein